MELFMEKYGSKAPMSWGPKLRLEYKYFTPEDYYETIVNKLVTENCDWADIGCGRDIFPSNRRLAGELAARAGFLQGIDPDVNIHDNPFVTEAFQGPVEEFEPTRSFDLVTLRMVAEHVEHPEVVVGNISALLKPCGFAVVYTPAKWAPVSVIARLLSHELHHPIKRWAWKTAPRDTFPVRFKMNTRRTLREFFERADMRERLFMRLDDCRVFGRFRWLNRLELQVRSLFVGIRLPYPEACLLGVYEKPAPETN